MNKSKIEWCDYTWNPVTGCLHGCEYCYARRMAKRFSRGTGKGVKPPAYYIPGAGYIRDTEHNSFIENANIHVVKWPMYDEWIIREGEYNYRYDPFPYGFEPTFHRYRLNEPQKITKPSKIFVCSMADLFGEWVPDEWINEVFKACERVPQHKYLFLTKNPYRYMQLHVQGKLPQHNNFWYGTTLTGQGKLPFNCLDFKQNFISLEPLLSNVSDKFPFTNIQWVIVGAQTGPGAVPPKPEWVQNIIDQCREAGVPVFLKNNLNWSDKIQEWPE